MKPNPQHVSAIKELIEKCAFPSLLGFYLTDLGKGFSKFEMEIQEKHMQPYGMAHGGNIATLIDSATFWSIYFSIGERCGLVNVDLKLNYLLPVKSGRLFAIGKEIKTGKTLAYAEASVLDENERLIAHGTSTIMILEGKGLILNPSIAKFLE